MTLARELSFLWIQQTLKMQVLETERLLLRQFCQEDLKDVATWQLAASEPPAEFEAQLFLDFCFQSYAKWGMGPWGMLLKKEEAIVGNCGFCKIDFKLNSGEVNYYVAERYRGQGLAPEALGVLLKFGFDDIGLSRIQARCSPDNTSSERVMLKAGMHFERMISSEGSSENGCRDEKQYAMAR